MTVTYTGNLKLGLPTTGTESGTWGDVVNQQITTLVDQAISGTVSLTSMTNADYTLTNGNGNAANEARYMALLVPSSLTLTAARNIIVPSTSKMYLVVNNSTGGFAVTVKTAAGAGVAVPSGTQALLYCNGTSVSTTGSSTPTGTINMWPTDTAPTGWLLADGSAVSRTTYATLFALVGSTFGAGDGSTTFNLPNYTNRMPIGSGGAYGTGATGGSADAIIVSHTHTFTGNALASHSHSATSGAFVLNAAGGVDTAGGSGFISGATTSSTTAAASAGTPSGTNSTTGSAGTNANLPPYIGIRFIIKT